MPGSPVVSKMVHKVTNLLSSLGILLEDFKALPKKTWETMATYYATIDMDDLGILVAAFDNVELKVLGAIGLDENTWYVIFEYKWEYPDRLCSYSVRYRSLDNGCNWELSF